MTITTIREVIGDSILLFALLICSVEAAAAERIEYDIRIVRQPLLAAVAALGDIAHVTIYLGGGLNELVVGPVQGRLTVEGALEQLLTGTGLIYIRNDARRYGVVRPVALPQPPRAEAAPTAAVNGGAKDRNSVTVEAPRSDEKSVPLASVAFDAGPVDPVGHSSVGEWLRDVPAQPHAWPEAWGDDSEYADLRGLGIDMSQVLINNRELLPSATSGVAFDLHAIPLSAVDHVEVLDDSAAAVLGGGAIGSVVNIELKRAGPPTARIEFGTAAGGGGQREFSLSAGSEGVRRKYYLLVDFFARSELPGEARAFSRDQDFSRFGGSDWRSRASWPGNISSTTGRSLPGLSSSFAAVPLETAGNDPAISDFQSTSGQYRLDSLRRFTSLLPSASRMSVFGSADWSFDKSSAFVEVIGVRRHADYQFRPPTLMGEVVPATNAFNPFNEAVHTTRLLKEIEPRRVITDSQWLRVVAGIGGPLRWWNWQVTAMGAREAASRWANNALDPERVANALASSDRSQALNVFSSGPVGSPELVASLVAAPSAVGYQSNGSEVSAAFRGPAFALPAGKVMFSIGAKWRDESAWSARQVMSGNAALSVPFWTDKLGADVTFRVNDFSDMGRVINWSHALSWRPLKSLQVRYFYGTGSRMPSTYELYGPSYAIPVLIADQRRNGEVRSVVARVGSSNEIEAVNGRSAAVAVTVTPIENLQMDVDWWRKWVDSRIAATPLSLVLEHEDAFQERIVRDAASPEDRATGMPGALRSINLLTANVGGMQTSGIDVRIRYRLNASVNTELSATWIDKFDSFDVPGGRPTERLAVAHPLGTIPRWRAFARLNWQNQAVSTSASARYIGSYEDVIGNQRTGRRIGSQESVDWQLSLAFAALVPDVVAFQEVTVIAGVLNVFDTAPRWASVGQDLGYDPSLSDPRQRYGYLRIEKQF